MLTETQKPMQPITNDDFFFKESSPFQRNICYVKNIGRGGGGGGGGKIREKPKSKF